MYSIHTGTLQYITPVHLSDEENTYRIPSFLLTWSVLVVVSSSGGRREEGCHLLLARYQGGVGTILRRDRRLVIGSFWLSELSRGNSIPAKIPVIIPVGHEETLKEQFHSAFRANRKWQFHHLDQTHNFILVPLVSSCPPCLMTYRVT